LIRQGSIYWADLGDRVGSAPAYRHPVVVVQNDVFNASRIRTVVVCAVSSNLKRAAAPGNVLLERGEGNLDRPSVVNISQVATLDSSQLEDWIGDLPRQRIREVVAGLRLLIEPREAEA
jgi:mRNA interferase MazF